VGQFYKHVSIIEKDYNGQQSWVLLVDGGFTEPSLSYFANHLIDTDKAKSTIDAYCRYVAHFIDFIIEASRISQSQGAQSLTGALLANIISLYPRALVAGTNSSDKQIVQLTSNLNMNGMLPNSSTVHIAAINIYLELNASLQQKLMELSEFSTGLPLISESQLFPDILTKDVIKLNQAIKINSKSVLAGVICGGAKYKTLSVLKAVSSRGAQPDQVIPFPANHVKNLIDIGFKSYRDKALFALAACSGARIHELLSICMTDGIDFKKRRIYLRNPRAKSPKDLNGWFTVEQISGLPFKSRTTPVTLLLEPFNEWFWDNLSLYLENEYIPSNAHPFLFQIIKGKNRGKPLLKGDSKEHSNVMRNLSRTFINACKLISVKGYAPHSLRHFYGDWCRNFYPTGDGFGLELTTIKELMGHASLESTMKYSRKDSDEHRLQQETFFSQLENSGAISLDTLRAIKLEKALNEVKERIALLGGNA
jgi:integrase